VNAHDIAAVIALLERIAAATEALVAQANKTKRDKGQ
jgi:hypothetical protein